jgi:coproporphyrinogen III oxidase
MERRENKRHVSDTAVMCSFLTTRRRGEPVGGIMKNYGRRGMYAELNAHFDAGTILVIRSTGSSTGCLIQDGYRSISLAEVKWSKSTRTRGDTCFATGLRYLMM